MADFMPIQDTDALAWTQVFAVGITSNPSLYMLTAADAVQLFVAVQ